MTRFNLDLTNAGSLLNFRKRRCREQVTNLFVIYVGSSADNGGGRRIL